jgi:hypothetical protein
MTSNIGLTTSSRTARRQALEIGLDRSVQIIRNASGLILESMAAIGRELIRVREQQLWLARHGSYYEFLDNEVKIPRPTAKKYCQLSDKWDTLKKELDGHPMPKTANEIEALDGVKEEHRGHVWRLALMRAEDLDITVNAPLVKSVIRENFLVGDRTDRVPLAPETVKNVSEARIRIGDLCGAGLLRSIDRSYYRVSEKEFLVWGRQPDEKVKFIGRAILRLGWSVPRAMERYNEEVDANTTIRNLVARAKAMDEPITIKIHGWKVSVKPE